MAKRGLYKPLFILLAMAALLFSASGSGAYSFHFKDANTPGTGQTGYAHEIGYIGSNLTLDSGNGTHAYNTTTQKGKFVNRTSQGSNGLVANASSEGRYKIWDEEKNVTQEIDLVNGNWDLVGRLNSKAGNLSSVNIDLYYWINGSKIDASNNDNFNKTTMNWNGSSERLYKVNSTKNKFWVEADSSGLGAFTGAVTNKNSQSVLDLEELKTQSNISGTVTDTSGSPVGGLEVKLKTIHNQLSRIPFMTGPPTKTVITDSNGHYNFSGLSSGSYIIGITNRSYKRTSANEFGMDAWIQSSNVSKTVDFNVTNNTGNVSVTIDGSSGHRYAILLESRKPQRTFMQPKTSSGTYDVTVPNGTYNLVVGKFPKNSPLSFQVESAGQVQVKTDQEITKDISFSERVYFNGTVNNSNTGENLSGVEVRLWNQSQLKRAYGTTDSDGHFSIKVENGTGYKITLNPDSSSNLKSKTENVTINATTTSQLNNYSLAKGETLTGNITDGNNRLEGASVYIKNFSKGVSKHDKTDSNGHYNISGLETGNYSIDIYPPEFGVGEFHGTIKINASGNTANHTLSSQKADLNGTIKNETGNIIDAKVTIENRDGFSSTNDTSSGKYGFANLDQGRFYRISIIPDNKSYERKTDYIRPSGDTEKNYTLSKISGITGYVKDGNNGVGNAFVYAYNRSADSYASSITDSDGFYSLDLPDKGHNITVYPDTDSNLQPNETHLSKSEITDSTEDNFSLSSGTHLAGYVKAADGSGLSGRISIWNYSSQSYSYTEIGNNGKYNLTGLKNVGHNVWISVDSSNYDTKRTSVGKINQINNEKNFTFNQNQGRKLRITVTDQDGNDIEDARVSTSSRQKSTDSNGEAIFPKQKNGTNVTVTANAEGYRGKSKEFVMKDRNVSTAGIGSGYKIKEYQNGTINLTSVREVKVKFNVTKGQSNNSVSGASVVLTSNETDISEGGGAVTGSAGEATVEHLAKGDYLISLVISEDTILRKTQTFNATGATGTINMSSKYDVWYKVKDQ